MPAPLELDLWEDKAWVSVVAFTMPRVRPRWLPAPLALGFHELNIRTYVHNDGKPGVYFFSLNANSRLAVWWARKFWRLNYLFARIDCGGLNAVRHYRCHRPGCPTFEVTYKVTERVGPAQPDTLEFFLTERYLLFTVSKGQVIEARVHHAPYDLFAVELGVLEDTLSPADGLPPVSLQSAIANYCPGVDVSVYAGTGEA